VKNGNGKPDKATTLAELRRRLDERDGYLSPEDGQVVITHRSRHDRRERPPQQEPDLSALRAEHWQELDRG